MGQHEPHSNEGYAISSISKDFYQDRPLGTINCLQIADEPSTQNLPSYFSDHASSSQSGQVKDPLQYINPVVFCNNQGQLPYAMGGMHQKPSWQQQYKTILCENWLAHGQCVFNEHCRFAHGEHELRLTNVRPMPRNVRKLKTKLCEKYTLNGVCPYGDNCFFIHPNPSNQFQDHLYQQADNLRGKFSASVSNSQALRLSELQTAAIKGSSLLKTAVTLLFPETDEKDHDELREQIRIQLDISEAKSKARLSFSQSHMM